MADAAARIIDCRGMRCPWPAIRAARALRESGGGIEVLADDPGAPRELAALAEAQGLRIVTLSPERFRFETVG